MLFRPRRCHGVGLVTAIFLLVVLAGLAVAMVALSTSQQASSTLDEQGARAYQAARAGIEWGLYQRLQKGWVCPAKQTIALPSDSSLAGFSVTVRCDKRGSDTDPLQRFVLTAEACNLTDGGECPNSSTDSLDYVSRKLEVQI